MSDPTEIRKLQGMAEENARQVKRQPVWDTRLPTSAIGLSVKVHQVAHGFSFGTVVVSQGLATWAAVSSANAEQYTPYYATTIGVVVSTSGPNDFVVGLSGTFSDPTSFFGIGVLGAPYYLSTTAGLLTQGTPPTNAVDYLMAICVPITTTSFYVYGGRALQQNWSIRDLADTFINYTFPTNLVTDGHVLVFNNTQKLWANKLNSVANLADVAVTAPANGDAIIYDTASTKWKNVPGFTAATHAADSVYGNATNATATATDIAASADNQTLVRISGTLQFAALPIAALANTAATTVLGNATNASAAVTAIAAAADNTVLIRTSGTLGFGTIPNAALQNSSITISGTAPIVIGGSGALGGTTTVTVSDASTSAKGVIQLAGDFAGTAALPVVDVNKITLTKLAQLTAKSVMANATASIANVAALTASADGQVLGLRGTTLSFALPQSFATLSSFTASTTFTVPAGVYCVFVFARGGGGGGGGSVTAAFANLVYAGGGGGQGGTGIGFLLVTPGATVTITIGAAGAAGSAGGGGGSAGGDSSAAGGTGGITTIKGQGGQGGSASTSGSNGNGGTGGAAGTSGFPGNFGIDGDNGQAARMSSFGSTGTAITTATAAGGQGGGQQGTNQFGGGGNGGANNAAGTVGTAGCVLLYY